jgi:hypothetical protein
MTTDERPRDGEAGGATETVAAMLRRTRGAVILQVHYPPRFVMMTRACWRRCLVEHGMTPDGAGRIAMRGASVAGLRIVGELPGDDDAKATLWIEDPRPIAGLGWVRADGSYDDDRAEAEPWGLDLDATPARDIALVGLFLDGEPMA